MKTTKRFAFVLTILLAAGFGHAAAASSDDGSLVMLVTFKVKPEQREAFKAVLQKDAEGARTESGNTTFEFYQAKDDANTFFLFERWTNQAALDLHFTQAYVKNVLELSKTALAKPMEILYLNDLAPLAVKDFKRPNGAEKSADKGVDLVVIFKVKDGMQERFTKQFLNSVKYSRPEAGNIAFHIHAVKGDPNAFVLYERWKSQQALDDHFAQSYTKELFEMFKSALAKPVEESLIFINNLALSAR